MFILTKFIQLYGWVQYMCIRVGQEIVFETFRKCAPSICRGTCTLRTSDQLVERGYIMQQKMFSKQEYMVYNKLSSVCKDLVCTKMKVLNTFSLREKLRAWSEFHTILDYCKLQFRFQLRLRTCTGTYMQFNCVLVSLMSVVTGQCLSVLHLLQTLTTSLPRGLVPMLDLAPVSLPLYVFAI